MKLDAGEIKDLVAETERKRAEWAEAADIWEGDYFGNRYEDSRKDKQDLDGVDVVVSPDPFNTIQLLQRFVAHEMRVEVPSLDVKEETADRSQTIEEWLLTFDVLSNRQQGCNHIMDMTWQSGVLGRGAAQVLWIGDVIPKGTSTDDLLPIWRRTLDPRNVGIARGPYWTDYAYHKYKTSRSEIEQRYPKHKLPALHGNKITQGYWNEKYTVIDFWYRHEGAIWHGVTINDEFVTSASGKKFPFVTDYPDIPIIEWYGDGAPVSDELGRSLSILHPIHELWKMKCDIMSKVATGLMYHFDPLIVMKGVFTDADVAVLKEVGPGAKAFLKENQSMEPFSPAPNVPMAQALLAMIQTGIDQATFPGVTYGDAPGGVNAGFAINNLAQQAQARANPYRQNIEAAVETENQMILALIESFAKEEGVQIYRRNSKGERGKPLKLTAKIIKGNYDNQVRLLPERPLDDTQKLLGWSNLVDKGLISGAFFRDEGMNVQFPRDEETRIRVERALKTPQMQLKADMRAMMHSYPQEEWDLLFLDTEYWPGYQSEMQWREQKAAKDAEAKEARRQERMQQEQQLLMEEMARNGLNPMGMPPGMMGDPMMQGLPPGGMPSGMPAPPLSGNLPPGLPGSLPPSDMGMQPPGMAGLPPSMAGQFDPNALGLGGAPAGTMDMMLGGPPPSEEELLRQFGGMPPQF